MAKKIQRTFYLEEVTMNYIESYQEQYNLSSISSALERIIFSLSMGNQPIVQQSKPIKNNEKKDIPQSILNIRKSMPE